MKQRTYEPCMMHLCMIDILFMRGYSWDKKLSIAAAGVALIKGKDLWLFSCDGEVVNDPDFIA